MHQNTQNVPKYYPSVKSYFHARMEGGGHDLLMIQRVSVVWVLDLMKIPEGGGHRISVGVTFHTFNPPWQ